MRACRLFLSTMWLVAGVALGQEPIDSADATGGPGAATVVVWQAGADGYHTYRIPALVVTTQGSVLAFCEGRKTSSADHGDIDLLLKRSEDGGRTWSAQQVVYEEGGDARITIGNPCPVVVRDRKSVV